ncbi:MAG: hypothetical protein RIK87_13740 [Fuerstiella sp.]
MITAIDFGCHAIRSACRNPEHPRHISLISERSEYVVLPDTDQFREVITVHSIPYAECEGSIVVFGNRAAEVRWLSPQPSAPLFTNGQVPTADAPARQILDVLTGAVLPQNPGSSAACCFTAPAGPGRTRTAEFLGRLLSMHGFRPVLCSATEATMLANGNDCHYTGVTICMGTETSEISISRYGVEIARECLDVGSAWIDAELARQMKIQVWDRSGECFLDLDSVRDWKLNPRLHLRNSTGERERTLSRLYGVVLDRIARTVRHLMNAPAVQAKLPGAHFSVICAGGPTRIGGFAGALTERFVEQDTASRLLTVRVADDASTAVVRGLLILAELQHAGQTDAESAA